MTDIEEFQREASRAFESDAEVNVVASISASRRYPTPRYTVCYSKGDSWQASGSANNAKDAIRECKQRLAQEHTNRIESLLAYAKANNITIP